MPSHPVLIVNLRSGNGRASAIELVGTAQRLGLETVTMQPGDDLAELAVQMVDGGCDHLMMAGGDGSLAIVAEVAMARDVPFSCVPVGTRNHFAMDLGLDRSHPLQSLDAALDGSEQLIDVGIVAGQVFLNNVSFGLYPRAIADPEYRSHRARSMADAAVDTPGISKPRSPSPCPTAASSQTSRCCSPQTTPTASSGPLISPAALLSTPGCWGSSLPTVDRG